MADFEKEDSPLKTKGVLRNDLEKEVVNSKCSFLKCVFGGCINGFNKQPVPITETHLSLTGGNTVRLVSLTW